MFRGLCRNSSGRALVAGAIGVLTGVEYLMTAHPTAPKPSPTARTDYFKISRTQSDLGYTYWVLQGFGKYRGFTLYDTWREAMDEAARRTKCASMEEQVEELVAV